jgi:hypothetical protein
MNPKPLKKDVVVAVTVAVVVVGMHVPTIKLVLEKAVKKASQ